MPQRPSEILVLDDEASYAEMIVSILREEGFAAVSFTVPAEALAWLAKHSCPLVIADYQMPAQNGADFLASVRENHTRMPFIIMSGNMNTRELLGVANLGVSSVLEKPIDRTALLESVSRFVERAKAAPKSAHHAVPHAAAPAHAAPAPKPVRKSDPYPATNLRSAQTSPVSRDFLQSLFDALKTSHGATLAMPLGGELELIVADIEHWFSLQPPAIRLSPTMMTLDLATMEGTRALVIIDARYATKDLGETVTELRRKLPAELPILVLVRSDAAKPCDGLPLVSLPSLSARVGDIATYARAIFERVGTAQSLAPEAARLLLHYPWPGNYYELMGALRRAVLSTDDPRISAPVLSSAIASGHGAVSPDAATVTLEKHLESVQARWFSEHGCSDTALAARAAALPESAFAAGISLQRQKLLFPDLLKPGA